MLFFNLTCFLELFIMFYQLVNYIEFSSSLIDSSYDVLEIDLEDIVTQLFCFGNLTHNFMFKLGQSLFFYPCLVQDVQSMLIAIHIV